MQTLTVRDMRRQRLYQRMQKEDVWMVITSAPVIRSWDMLSCCVTFQHMRNA
jgi:hypothetical protein